MYELPLSFSEIYLIGSALRRIVNRRTVTTRSGTFINGFYAISNDAWTKWW